MDDEDDGRWTPENPWRPPAEREPPAMDHAAGWKASEFSWAMGELILARIEHGETMRQVTADPRMPSYATVYRWIHVHADFGAAYRDLRAEMAAQARRTDRERAVAREWRFHHERRLAGKPERRWRSGRRSSYTEARGWAVCERLCEGAAISAVLREPGMPSAKVVYRWLRTSPEFRKMYAEACRWREEHLVDLAYEVAVQGTPATLKATKAKLAALDGRMGRIRPRKYRW